MIDNLTIFLSPAAAWIGLASVKSLFVIALVLLCRWLLANRLSAQAIYSLWFAVIVCLIVPFGMSLHLPEISSGLSVDFPGLRVDQASPPAMLAEPPVNPGRSNEVPAVEAAVPAARYVISETPPADFSIVCRLIVAWAGVACVLFAATLWNLARYLRIRALASPVASPAHELFVQCKRELNVQRAVRLLETTQVRSPAVFGWWSPTILLPAGLTAQLHSSQLRHVFLHELSHVQRYDVAVNWLIAVVQILHWFNPCVWYALRKMRADMEWACDAAVMRHLSRPEQLSYGDTLIKLTDFYPACALAAQGAGIVENHSQLKGRIEMIARFDPKRIRYSMLAVAALMAVTSVALTQPRLSTAPSLQDTPDVAQLEPAMREAMIAAPPLEVTLPVIDKQVIASVAKPGIPQLRLALADSSSGPDSRSGDSIAQQVMIDAVVVQLAPGKLAQLGVSLAAGNLNFDALLRDLRGDGASKIISTPRLLALDNTEVEIRVMREVPFIIAGATQQAGPFENKVREPQGLILKITPQVTANEAIVLQISQENSRVEDATAAGMITNKRTLSTRITLASGGVAVIGTAFANDGSLKMLNENPGETDPVMFIRAIAVPEGARWVSANAAQPKSANGIPMSTLIEKMAARTGKTFIVDPQAGSASIVGPRPEQLDYAHLVSVLRINGFSAEELNGHVRIAPLANAEFATRIAYLRVLNEVAGVLALKQAAESSKSALQATEVGYEAGKRTKVEMSNARQSLLTAQTNYRSRYDDLINSLQLKQASGALAREDLNEITSWLTVTE